MIQSRKNFGRSYSIVKVAVIIHIIQKWTSMLYIPYNVLRYVGRTFVKVGGKPREILEKLNEFAGFAPEEEIELYEVCLLC